MNLNACFSDAVLGLPEDIRRLKEAGYFDEAVRLLDRRMAGEDSDRMRRNYMAQREMLLRTPHEYPYSMDAALARVREVIPDFTMHELREHMDSGRIIWHFVNGEKRLIASFFGTLEKTVPAFAARLPQKPEAAGRQSHELLDRAGRLNRAVTVMRETGSMSARIRMRATLRIKDGSFVPGETYRVWLPIPAACIQQSGIALLGFSSPPICVADEHAAQRTVFWEETMTENHPFWVEYAYTHTAPFADPLALRADPVQPDFDTGELAPHIVFTPYIRALCAELTAGVTDPIEKARRIYEYVTTRVTYSFVPDYFTMDSIAETCLRTRRGDCGVQALAFITLCRCAGIPAKWQSGLVADPESVGSHDWAMFYVAPHGWLFADPSFGGSAYRAGVPARHRHYFGNLDVYRCVTVNGYQQPFDPAMRFWRHDPYDNQVGEVEDSGRGYRRFEAEHSTEMLEFLEL